MDMNRTTIWLTDKDRDAIETIKEKYGIDSNSAVIRLALRILAASDLEIHESLQNQTRAK